MSLPPIPENHVYLGPGPIPGSLDWVPQIGLLRWSSGQKSESWTENSYGTSPRFHYCVLHDSPAYDYFQKHIDIPSSQPLTIYEF